MRAKKRQPRSRQPQPAAGAATGQLGQELPHLPEPVLTAILQHVPLRERLTSASLVCSSWARAAACTSAEVVSNIIGPEGCSKMQRWLELAGGQVSSLALFYCSRTPWEAPSPSQNRLLLPCGTLSRLESLRLHNVSVVFNVQQQQQQGGVSTRSRRRASVLAATAGSSGAGAASRLPAAAAAGQGRCLPALQELVLSHCKIRLDSFAQLCQSLTGLSKLHLHCCTFCTPGWAPVGSGQVNRAVKAALQQLQGLAQLLLLDGVVLGDTEVTLSPLSTMQRLQRVGLSSENCRTAALAHLPATLTALDLHTPAWADAALLDANPESLPPLPLLRELNLTRVALDPRVLARWSGLQRLVVVTPLLHGPGLLGPEDAMWDDEDMIEDAGRVFLQELGKLKQLQELSLCGLDLEDVTDAQHLTALTASPQLTSLCVSDGSADEPAFGLPLPQGALQHMLPQGQQWPLLQQLRLEMTEPDDDLYEDWCVDGADVARMAECLPALSSLHVVYVLRDVDAVAALTALTSLTKLAVGGNACVDEAAGHVAKLTLLNSLEWNDSYITSLGLLKLTALTNLDSLIVLDCHVVDGRVLDAARGDVGLEVYTSLKAEAAGTHDVWRQLRQLCRHDPACRRAGSRAGGRRS